MADHLQAERYTKWKELIHEQIKSGLTQTEFCKQRKLVLSQFSYYRGVLLDKPQSDSKKVKASLSPVKIAPADSNSASDIRLTLPNGFQCLFSSRLELTHVKRLMEVLLSC